jgi:hypothetical protein
VIVAVGPKVSTVTLALCGDLGAARAAAGDQSSGRLIELAQRNRELRRDIAP